MKTKPASNALFVLSLMVLALALQGCQESPQPVTTSPESTATDATAAAPIAAPSPAASPAELANALYEEFYDGWLELNPIQATFIGDHRFNDRMPNYLDPIEIARLKAFEVDYLERLTAIDNAGFRGQDRLNYNVFRQARETSIEGYDFPNHLIPLNQFYNLANWFAMLGSGSGAQPFATVTDYENWLKRTAGFVVIMDQAIANMGEGKELGIVQPKILMERVLPQLEAHLVDDATESLFYRPVAAFPDGFEASDQERLRAAFVAAINDQIVPAYRRLRDYVRDEYLPFARDTHGMGALPGGDAWYAYNVRSITTTNLTPDAIHDIGLSEVGRIHDAIRTIMQQVGFEGDLKAFFDFTKNDPQFYFDEKDQLLNAYRDFRSTVEPLLPKLFDVAPQADYEIRAVEPFRERSSSAASYQRASADGSRPGIFYVNTYDLSARPSWGVESLFLHEAAPGHHFQIAIQQELEGLPRFRKFGGATAFVEGWGLYSESLGLELGVYTDPYQHFGALVAELWRAIRLVVDTGLHAKGWTREEVLEYMYANAPVAEARAVSEAERFMAIPGQALAYKIGQLKIAELRKIAEQDIGDRFDVRAFHREILRDGSLPLSVLEDKISSWVSTEST